MKKIGVTGGIGSGKTIVSKILEALEYPVYNSDTRAKEIVVENENVLNISLLEDVSALDEVVVIGYGTIKKSDATNVLIVISPTLGGQSINIIS